MNHRDQVPIGSSSASMYPGYSPADHVYGEAAAEFGQEWHKAKREGHQLQLSADGPQYEFGQAKGAKKRKLEESRGGTSQSDGASQNGRGLNGNGKAQASAEDGSDSSKNPASSQQKGNPLFVIDTNPTPVPELHSQVGGTNLALPVLPAKPSKRAKTAPEDAPASNGAPLEHEDIEQEVDQRLKAKEERRKQKEKKRKRHSEGDSGLPQSKAAGDSVEEVAPKPAKKKSKKVTSERPAEPEGEERTKERLHAKPAKPKKKSKKDKATA